MKLKYQDKFCETSSKSVDIRDNIEYLRSKVAFLPEPQKTLIKMYFENSNSFSQIAKLTGVSETTVARRVYRILNRLAKRYVKFEPQIKNGHIRLSKFQEEVARDYYLKGMSITDISNKWKVSYFRVRKIINMLNSHKRKIKNSAVAQRRY